VRPDDDDLSGAGRAPDLHGEVVAGGPPDRERLAFDGEAGAAQRGFEVIGGGGQPGGGVVRRSPADVPGQGIDVPPQRIPQGRLIPAQGGQRPPVALTGHADHRVVAPEE
jgi:hypothetical protein